MIIFKIKQDYTVPVDSLDQLVYETDLTLVLTTERVQGYTPNNEEYYVELGKSNLYSTYLWVGQILPF